jgi:hypothetical protein
MADALEIRVEATPNPNARKFSTNRIVWSERAQTFSAPEQALTFPLARALLGIPGVASAFFLRDFVTISCVPDAAWEPITAQVEALLRAHLGGSG